MLFPPDTRSPAKQRAVVMAKPSKISILASKIHLLLRECSDEDYTAVELYSMQMILKEELSRSWLFDVLSVADRTTGVISLQQKQVYQKACQSVSDGKEGEVRERHEWLEKKLTSFRRLSLMHQTQEKRHEVDPLPAPVIRLAPQIVCSNAVENLVSVLWQACDKNPGTADVDLVNLSLEVCNRLNATSQTLKRLMFDDVEKYLTQLALESASERQELGREGLRLKRVMLLAGKRLESCEESMCQFLHSIEKRKGCWIREVTRLLSEATSPSCRAKVPALQHFPRSEVDFKEADQVLDSVVIDSSLTAEDDLDLKLRQLEQKIRR